jgi:hypothetical protein
MNNVASRLVTSFNAPSPLLRRALLIDAVLTAVTGIALVLAAGPLSAVLGLPTALLRSAGAIFIPYGAFAGWLGMRPRVYRPLVFALIVLNALWAVDSVLLLLTRWLEPTPWGEIFIVAQAVFTGVIAEVQFIGLRRSTVVESYARL